MDEVIPTNAQRIPVAGDHPHREVRASQLQACRHRRGSPMDRMHAIGVHVVRKAAGTSNPRNKDRLLGRDSNLWQDFLHLSRSNSRHSLDTNEHPGRWQNHWTRELVGLWHSWNRSLLWCRIGVVYCRAGITSCAQLSRHWLHG